MTDLMLAAVFGLCTIATVFVAIGWAKVLRGPTPPSAAYFFSSIGIMTANIGVMIMCANRTTAFMGWGEFFPYMLIIPAVVILIGKSLWLYGATATGRNKRLVYIYLTTCAAWIGYCIWKAL